MKSGGNVGGFDNTYEKHWKYLVFLQDGRRGKQRELDGIRLAIDRIRRK